MPTYRIFYYDIGWNVYHTDVTASNIEQAIDILVAACACTRSEVFNYFTITTCAVDLSHLSAAEPVEIVQNTLCPQA